MIIKQSNYKMMETTLELEMNHLEKENTFLKQIVRIMSTTYFDNSVWFRVQKDLPFGNIIPTHYIKCDENTEYFFECFECFLLSQVKLEITDSNSSVSE